MNIEELDLNGGTFKASFPYHWIGWLVWVIGVLITLFGLMLALSDTVALLMSAIGLVVMSMATPGSLQGSLHKVRQNAIDPAELQAKADASGLSIDNWWMQQTSYVPPTIQVTGFYLHQVQQHGTIQTDMVHTGMVHHYLSTQ